jgi:signal transduction histidine kinase
VAVNGAEYVQGCWLDWPAIARWLTSEIADLFPRAHLAPADEEIDAGPGRSLAALPVLLTPGPPALGPAAAESPIRLSLIIAWVGVLLAAAAVVILLLGTVSLSERRGAFVSAVTHELRTPLTTFRLYTDMLADGMVTDAEKQRQYLHTLHAEATRLGHLVENVLAYARLERGRAATRVERVPLADLLQRVQDRLADRAIQAGMRLVVQPPDAALQTACVQADTSVVEQILFNLVDNACKYAGGGEEKLIHLSAAREGEMVALQVRDHGPGIPESQAGRLFRPFRKSARDTAQSAPGVGLGLALSRRLARRLGGDLRVVPCPAPGACFGLTLRSSLKL